MTGQDGNLSDQEESPHRLVRAIHGVFGCLFAGVALVLFASASYGIVEIIRTEAWYHSLWMVPMLLLAAPLVGLFLGIPPTSSFWLIATMSGLIGGALVGWWAYQGIGVPIGLIIGGVVGHLVGTIPMGLVLMFMPAEFVTPILPDQDPPAEVADGTSPEA